MDRDASSLGEFEGVCAEVDKDLSQAGDVTQQVLRHVVVNAPEERQDVGLFQFTKRPKIIHFWWPFNDTDRSRNIVERCQSCQTHGV